MTIGWVPASFAARSSANSPIRRSPTVSVSRARVGPTLHRTPAPRYGCAAGQAAAEAYWAFEETPDITGQGGRAIDPGKPAGKCHRNKPPMSAVPRERPTGKGEMVR
jgi:hypothetical protein